MIAGGDFASLTLRVKSSYGPARNLKISVVAPFCHNWADQVQPPVVCGGGVTLNLAEKNSAHNYLPIFPVILSFYEGGMGGGEDAHR